MVLFHLYTGAFGAFPDIIQRALHVGGTLILAVLASTTSVGGMRACVPSPCSTSSSSPARSS